MLPEPTYVSQNALSDEPTLDNRTTSSQHGIRDHQPASLLTRKGEPGESQSGLGGRDLRSTSPQEGRIASSDGTPRLSPVSPSPRNRIAEYENASSPVPKKKARGPLFEVVKQDKKSGNSGVSLNRLPNEILTHTISHLSPDDLATVSLLSRRFNDLVTSPHAWMGAFARYFPGPDALLDPHARLDLDDTGETIRSGKRSFTRLTALASWRSEYILRTRLLRSLVRGKPVQNLDSSPSSSRAGQVHPLSAVIMYAARTFTTINHLHATFGSGLNKRVPRLIHGADDVGMVTSSDPTTGKVDPWGERDPSFYAQFCERFPGVAEWGLGAGEVVGCPNVMDVSQPHGMIYGQGCPEGSCYYRSLDQMRGQYIGEPTDFSRPEAGIPKIGIDGGAVCSVWIAKTTAIPTLSDGLIGLLFGSAAGVVTACSLGNDGVRGHRLQRGELTARWVLSPGVPIIAFAVDENYSIKRQALNRIWAVALNALGEVYYLTKFPTRSTKTRKDMDTLEHSEYMAWLTGRTVYWNLVEPSRRVARPDPYQDSDTAGSYSPRSSWDGMCLSSEQILAETKEIQQYLRKPPKEFRKVCLGWDMRRRLEVDFAGDDGNSAGEAIVVFDCGLQEGDDARVRRFTRWRNTEGEKEKVKEKENLGPISTASETNPTPSLFGTMGATETPHVSTQKTMEQYTLASLTIEKPRGFNTIFGSQRNQSSSYLSSNGSPERVNYNEEWRCSHLTFGGLRVIQLATTALDHSKFATLTLSEDPALGFSTTSTASSPYASPMSVASQPALPSDIPGQRARFMAAGTKSGIILVWDVRSPVCRSSEYSNSLDPVRIIYTESPEISCIALTALHLVHGGNDGLVQAWDVLASTEQPIKTLNSRFSSRARRRLVQAQASAQGVGINMFAAGAICLDPDPTVLRGAVSLGNQIRYWSYSSTAADQFKGSKRRLRRSERGSNNGGERFSGASRVNLKDYIANEKYELEREQKERRKKEERLAGRFGVDLLGSEEEALAYAALLSQETLELEEKRRKESEASSALTSHMVTPEPSITGGEDVDADIAEAIRLSLQESSLHDSPVPSSPPAIVDIPIKYAKGRKPSPRRASGEPMSGSSKENELSDLEFALQLSLAEEQSRKEAEQDEFPALNPGPGHNGKGKGRMR